jgi:hypothetical protein
VVCGRIGFIEHGVDGHGVFQPEAREFFFRQAAAARAAERDLVARPLQRLLVAAVMADSWLNSAAIFP